MSSSSERGRNRSRAPLALIALGAAAALVGCGGGGSSTTTTVSAVGNASASRVPVGQTAGLAAAHAEAVVTVGRAPITKTTFEHWVAVTAAVSHAQANARTPSTALKNRVLGFLITSNWVLGEAAHLGISVSDSEAHRRLVQVTAKQFPKASQLKRYLASIGETEADLLWRIEVELLESKISQRVTAGRTAASEIHTLLSGFQRSFEARWRRRTSCRAGYVMEDCRQYKGPLHPPGAAGTGSASAAGSSSSAAASSSSSTGSGTARANTGGEVPPGPPGAMALSSPAFELNGAIPAQYTCDGANISPPMRWTNLPAHTAELVLFVIDDSSIGKEGGIRWVVAGLEPSLTGIAAGRLPAGAIVGLNGSGNATYGGICPPKGKPATIEFVLWALSKKIPLSSGFTPALAEHEYSHSELGSAATYASYARG